MDMEEEILRKAFEPELAWMDKYPKHPDSPNQKESHIKNYIRIYNIGKKAMMDIQTNRLEEEEEPVTKWNPILITGGKEQPPENWLANLPRRSVFLIAPKAKVQMTEQQKQQIKTMPAVEEYHIMFHSPGGHTWLLEEGREPDFRKGEKKLWVNTLNFSRAFECKEVLYDPVRDGTFLSAGEDTELVPNEGTEEA